LKFRPSCFISVVKTESRYARWAVAAEIAAFVAVALLSKYLMSLFFWRYAGPASLLLTLGMLTLCLRARGLRWSAMGRVPLPGLKARLMVIPQAGLALVAFAAAVALTTIAGPALGFDFLRGVPAGVDDRWGDVAGSLPLILLHGVIDTLTFTALFMEWE